MIWQSYRCQREKYDFLSILWLFLRSISLDLRCKICHSPFEGMGVLMLRGLLGRKQSALNPNFCNVCEDFAKKNPGAAR